MLLKHETGHHFISLIKPHPILLDRQLSFVAVNVFVYVYEGINPSTTTCKCVLEINPIVYTQYPFMGRPVSYIVHVWICHSQYYHP